MKYFQIHIFFLPQPYQSPDGNASHHTGLFIACTIEAKPEKYTFSKIKNVTDKKKLHKHLFINTTLSIAH